jgi:hypothetical protein
LKLEGYFIGTTDDREIVCPKSNEIFNSQDLGISNTANTFLYILVPFTNNILVSIGKIPENSHK